MKYIIIVGTRPQFLKLSPLVNKMQMLNLNYIIIHSGQHYDEDMSENLFKTLNIKEPDYLLYITGSTIIEKLCNMMCEIEKICLKENPDKIIVFGDCDTTISGALVANKLKINLIHIEAGMRSYNKDMPEEINRIITDNISNTLLCSTPDSLDKLNNENITKNIYFVGNLQLELLNNCCTMYHNEDILINNNITKNNYVLLTIHREYNTNKKMLEFFFKELKKINKYIIFPIHPRTKKIILTNNILIPENIIQINPVNYLDMTILQRYCCYIITDSGGIQPEANYLNKKCIILRKETEWIYEINNGNNILYDYNTSLDIFINTFLKVPKTYEYKLTLNVSSNILNYL